VAACLANWHLSMPVFSQTAGPMAARQHAGSNPGGRWLPVLAQAACATCQLARHAATERWSLLTKNLTFHWSRWSFSSKIYNYHLLTKVRHISFLWHGRRGETKWL
jgi:hypothetical protein